jgi:hypothetical protein
VTSRTLRRLRRAVGAAAAGVIGTAGLVFTASAQESQLSVRAGFERISGDYGGVQNFDDLYAPLSVLYERARVGLRVTVPYLEVEFADPDGMSTFTESGLGDVVLGLTVYDVVRSRSGNLVVDVTGKLKLPTADEDKGLGTGETDYSLQADIYRFLGRGTMIASAGYKVRGDPQGAVFEDSLLVSLGGLYEFSTWTSGGLFLDYRQSSVPAFESIRELTALLSRRLDDRWRVQGYVVRGLSDTSLDWSLGFSARRDF